MQREDYLLREIARLGQFIEALIGRIRTRRDDEENNEIGSEMVEFTTDGLNYTLEELAGMSVSDIIELLEKTPGFNEQNIELLADAFFSLGVSSSINENSNSVSYLHRAKELYTYLDSSSSTLSMNRMIKMQDIDRLL